LIVMITGKGKKKEGTRSAPKYIGAGRGKFFALCRGLSENKQCQGGLPEGPRMEE